MDREYIDNFIQELINLRAQVIALCSLKHLTKEEKIILQNKFDMKERSLLRIFRKRKNKGFRVDGALANMYSEIETQDLNLQGVHSGQQQSLTQE